MVSSIQPISTFLFLLFQYFVVLSFIFQKKLLEKNPASRTCCHICKIYGHNHEDLFESYGRSSPTELFLGKAVLKICNKFTGEH